jgi:hypothetical protein
MGCSPLKYWEEAMTLRYFPQDGESLLPKIPALNVPSAASSVVFGSAVEVMTMEELKLLQEDFERYHMSLDEQLPFVKQLKIQALLVIRRIFTQVNLGHPHWIYLRGLLGLVDTWTLGSNIYILLLILEQMNGFDPKLLPLDILDFFIRALHLLSINFLKTLSESSGNPASGELSYDNLLAPTEFITTISKFFPNPAMISSVNIVHVSFASTVYRFLFVLDSISPRLTNQEKQKLEGYYSNYIRNFFPERMTTVLHEAVTAEYTRFFS